MTTSLDISQRWLELGIATIPIQYRGKRPDWRVLPNGVWQPYQTNLPTLAELKAWFNTRFRNIALVTGWQGLCILDFDFMPFWNLWKGTMQGIKTYTVYSARGVHLYLKLREPLQRTIKIKAHDGTGLIDIKGNGYCLIPNSIHPSGHRYHDNNEKVMTVDSIYDVLPKQMIDIAMVNVEQRKVVTGDLDPFKIKDESCGVERFNTNARVLELLPYAIPNGRQGWYKVQCPFTQNHAHGDRSKSAWINDNKNRFGCSVCVNGSMSVVDLYMALHGVDFETAIREM